MLWLTWQMWILLSLAFLGGMVTGWMMRGQSDEPEAKSLPSPKVSSPARATVSEPVKTVASASSGQNAPYGVVKGAASEPEIMSAPSDHEDEDQLQVSEEAEEAAKPQFRVIEGRDEAEGEDATDADSDADSDRVIPQAPPQEGDDLTQIRGLGPKAALALNEAGVKSLSQIAGWGADDIDHFDRMIGARGRIEREDWVGQAKALIQ